MIRPWTHLILINVFGNLTFHSVECSCRSLLDYTNRFKNVSVCSTLPNQLTLSGPPGPLGLHGLDGLKGVKGGMGTRGMTLLHTLRA